jgi:TRAP-type uncharacterized transport system fused permease subunit
MGMGMSTTAVYITVATLIVPALITMGVYDVSAHMFCFYFGVIGNITPPVAMAAYTAAGISGASANETGWEAFLVGIAAYIVPFLIISRPELLLHGSVWGIAQAVVITVLAIWLLAGLVQRHMLYPLKKLDILLCIVGIILALTPTILSDIGAVVIGALMITMQLIKRNKGEVLHEAH